MNATWRYADPLPDDYAYEDEIKVIPATPIHTIWTADGHLATHLGWAKNCTHPDCQPTEDLEEGVLDDAA